MKYISWPVLFLLFTIINPGRINAQEATDSTAAYKWFDKVVGVENTGLLNGIEYIEQHVTINDRQKFLGNIYFTKGNLVYEGQTFYDVEMKYNVYDDLLLLRGAGSQPLQLHKSRVGEFSIHGLNFMNVQGDSTSLVNGFYEEILDTGTLILLKKHTKKLSKHLDRSFTYFEFKDDTPFYALAYNNKFYPASSRSQVIKAFPELRSEIRKFYREQRSGARSNPDLFMANLTQKITQLTSSNIPGE